TQLNFGNIIKFNTDTFPFLVPYKEHFLACFFITEYSSGINTAEIKERDSMQVRYITITSDGILESYLFDLDKKVYRNWIARVGLCGDRIFIMGDAAYVVNLNSKTIETNIL